MPLAIIFSFLDMNNFCWYVSAFYICAGEMAERSNAAVLKTVDCHRSGGSNPSLSAFAHQSFSVGGFRFFSGQSVFRVGFGGRSPGNEEIG